MKSKSTASQINEENMNRRVSRRIEGRGDLPGTLCNGLKKHGSELIWPFFYFTFPFVVLLMNCDRNQILMSALTKIRFSFPLTNGGARPARRSDGVLRRGGL